MRQTFLLSACVLLVTFAAADSRDAKPSPLNFDLTTAAFQAGDGFITLEISGAIAGDKGKGKLRVTRLAKNAQVTYNVFGDQTIKQEDAGSAKDGASATTSEHEVTFELAKSPEDPSSKKDRKLFKVRGEDLDIRGVDIRGGCLLMVSPSGTHRLVFCGRCGGVHPVTLEPRASSASDAK